MILGRVVMFPIPGQPLPYYDAGAEGITGGNTTLGEFDQACKYEWCKHIPAVHIAQFMVGFLIATVSSITSKVSRFGYIVMQHQASDFQVSWRS